MKLVSVYVLGLLGAHCLCKHSKHIAVVHHDLGVGFGDRGCPAVGATTGVAAAAAAPAIVMSTVAIATWWSSKFATRQAFRSGAAKRLPALIAGGCLA